MKFDERRRVRDHSIDDSNVAQRLKEGNYHRVCLKVSYRVRTWYPGRDLAQKPRILTIR